MNTGGLPRIQQFVQPRIDRMYLSSHRNSDVSSNDDSQKTTSLSSRFRKGTKNLRDINSKEIENAGAKKRKKVMNSKCIFNCYEFETHQEGIFQEIIDTD